MILFLHGEDDFSVNRRRRDLQQAFKEKYSESEVSVFDFEDQSGPEDLRRAFGACEGGLFASHKMVVFLHPSALEGPAEDMLKTFLKEQVKKEDDTVLLFVEPRKIKKTHPIISFLIKHAGKEEAFPKPDAKDQSTLAKLVEKELSVIASGMKFSREALRMFISIVGTDRARVASEIEKLVAYKGGEGMIEAEDIALLLEGSKESAIFDALDALGRGDRQRALILLDRETEGGDGAYQVLAMCAWQVRRMLMVREAYDQGMRHARDIALTTKLAPFVVQKALGTIDGFPLARLKAGLALLSDSDTKLKTGGMDPQVALSLFIWKF
jgi:DNA polymerase-3 subunit delta